MFIASAMIATVSAADVTSLLDPCGRIARGATVGPGCLTEGDVRIGPRTCLIRNVSLRGPLRVGAANSLEDGVCIGYEPQDRKYDPGRLGPGVCIGRHNMFGERVTVHRATSEDRPTTIGDRNRFYRRSHVGHDCQVGDDCVFEDGASLGGHVVVGDQVRIGRDTAIHQFCRIGRLALFSPRTAAGQDVPPFCHVTGFKTVGGLNEAGLEQAGWAASIVPLLQALRIVYHRGFPLNRAVERIRAELGDQPLCLELARFIADSRRGVTPWDPQAQPPAERQP